MIFSKSDQKVGLWGGKLEIRAAAWACRPLDHHGLRRYIRRNVGDVDDSQFHLLSVQATKRYLSPGQVVERQIST